MYLTHFGLRHRPFRNSPDPESYYPATSHELALAGLRDGLDDDEGIMVLTAEPGLGKTLVIQRLNDQFPASSRVSILTHSRMETRRDLLGTLAYDLGLSHEGQTESELRIALTESCLQHFRGAGRTVFILDEAQNLNADLLEELRMFSNLEGRDGRAVQVILVGLPELVQTLQSSQMAAITQRITVASTLTRLEPHEAAEYLSHQVRAAGGRPEKILTPEAVEIITSQLPGIPRLLNQVGHTCLKMAARAELKEVDAEVALEVVEHRLATLPGEPMASTGEATMDTDDVTQSASESRDTMRMDDPHQQRLFHQARKNVA